MTRGPVFDGKVVAITGAASGIGRACALGATNDGARVALIDRHGTQSVEAEIAADGGIAASLCCDVQDTDAVNLTFSRIEADLGGLDVLINCAGTMGNWPTPMSDTTDEDWAVVVDTNLKGIFACCRAALPMLRRSKGAIVNIASELGLVGTAGLVVCGATKAGVMQLSRGLAVEEGPNEVRVNTVEADHP